MLPTHAVDLLGSHFTVMTFMGSVIAKKPKPGSTDAPDRFQWGSEHFYKSVILFYLPEMQAYIITLSISSLHLKTIFPYI